MAFLHASYPPPPLPAEDPFNLYGLRADVRHFRDCLATILDVRSAEEDHGWDEALFAQCRDLYGLIHARYILTSQGMAQMLSKVESGLFGGCPRADCSNRWMLPMGVSDQCGVHPVKLYCPACSVIYHCYDELRGELDGAYFGTTFPHLLVMMRPGLVESDERARPHVPRVFGFRVVGRPGSRVGRVANIYTPDDPDPVRPIEDLAFVDSTRLPPADDDEDSRTADDARNAHEAKDGEDAGNGRGVEVRDGDEVRDEDEASDADVAAASAAATAATSAAAAAHRSSSSTRTAPPAANDKPHRRARAALADSDSEKA
jgi:casein kinase II subunit beta